MPNVAILPSQNPYIGVLHAVVDGWPDMMHRLETTSGGAPVESGARITDHAIAREEQVELTGWVSSFEAGGSARAGDCWETLRRLHRDVAPVELVTPWGTYPEMIIHRAIAEQVGLGMRFTLRLQQVIRVGIRDNELTEADVSGPAERRTSQVERGRVIPRQISL